MKPKILSLALLALPGTGAYPALHAAVAAVTGPVESPSVLLQRGIFAEETQRDLDAAIRIYSQIVAQGEADRAIVAEARYRLALSYQKKGDKVQAIKLLNQLVQQQPPDEGLSKKAREALTALGETPSTALSIHQVVLPFSDIAGLPWTRSNDGRYYAYESAEDLRVGDMSTGKSWPVLHEEKGKETTWDSVRFSPDGRQIAFDVTIDGNIGTGIFVASLDGSGLRRIYRCAEGEDIYLLRWSQDGNRIFVRDLGPKADGEDSLVTFDVRSGAKTVIATREVRSDGPWGLSPDGKMIDIRSRGAIGARTITVRQVASGRETTIATDARFVLGWLPDSKGLIFSKTSETGGIDLWLAGADETGAAHQPERIWSNLGAGRTPNLWPDGTVYFVTKRNGSEPYQFWEMEGVLALSQPVPGAASDVPVAGFIGPGNAVDDREAGVTMKLPADWSVQRVTLRANSVGRVPIIELHVPDSDTVATLSYYPTDPWQKPAPDFPLADMGAKPVTPDQIDAWMLHWAHTRDEKTLQANPDVVLSLRPAGYVARSINGHRTLTWSREIRPKTGEPQIEFLTMSFTDKIAAMVWMRGPAAKAEPMRATHEALAGSLHLP